MAKVVPELTAHPPMMPLTMRAAFIVVPSKLVRYTRLEAVRPILPIVLLPPELRLDQPWNWTVARLPALRTRLPTLMRLVPPVEMIGWDCRVLPPATTFRVLNVATVSTEPVPMTTRLPP